MRTAVYLVLLVGVAGTPAGQQVQPPVVRTTTTGVVLDVTVVDRKGQVVVDLGPEDFQLSENGVRQAILSVTLVQGGVARSRDRDPPGHAVSDRTSPPASTAAAPPRAGPALDDTPTVTAILFDRLSPETRSLARRAALAYISTLSNQRDYAGVFLADLSFRTFQPFTTQADHLRQAVDRLAANVPSSVTADAERARNTRARELDPNQSRTAGAESGSGWVSVGERERRLNAPGPEGIFARMELRMEEGYLQFLSELGGQASLAGLTATVSSLGLLPGRKSVLYLTENLPVTSNLKTKFDGLIDQANRQNVTIYTVDAAGLRVHSKEAEVGRNVDVAGAQGIGDASRPEGSWLKELERQEELLSSRPTAALGRLAKETGGFLLDNTNDLAKGVARMQQERTTYYLLAYQSSRPALDGTFRRIEVKVKRPNVRVGARSGYRASPVAQD